MYGLPDAAGQLSGDLSAGHTFLCKIVTFLNGYILLTYTIGSIYTKLGDFVNLGELFQTMWINSC